MNQSTYFGLTPAEWMATKVEIRAILVEVACRGGVVTYGELVKRVQTAHLEPDSHALAALLGEISEAEDAGGRGMLSVVVVRQEDWLPGGGFFHLAEARRRGMSDRMKCWTEEFKRVQAAWARPPAV